MNIPVNGKNKKWKIKYKGLKNKAFRESMLHLNAYERNIQIWRWYYITTVNKTYVSVIRSIVRMPLKCSGKWFLSHLNHFFLSVFFIRLAPSSPFPFLPVFISHSFHMLVNIKYMAKAHVIKIIYLSVLWYKSKIVYMQINHSKLCCCGRQAMWNIRYYYVLCNIKESG